jgi:sulfur-oxidizing protein SoxX
MKRLMLLAAMGATAAAAQGDAARGAGNGDAARGAAIAASRSQGLCVLCHALPGQPAALAGTVGPPLAGVASRLDAAALRARLLEPERFNPDTVMPAYGRTDTSGLQQVAPAQRGKPLLGAAEIDDLVAWLATLR